MEEDSKLFLRRIDKLCKIWDKLKSFTNTNNISVLKDLKDKSQKIPSSVKDGSLNAGGKFEWVDSILIKVKNLTNTFLIFQLSLIRF